MKKIRLVEVFTALGLLSFSTVVLAQRTGVWEIADTTPMKYIAWRSNLAAANSSDFALIAETNSFPLLHVVRHSTDGGATWNILYSDSSKGTARWNTVLHRTAQEYLIAGDSEHYLGQDANYNVFYRYQGFLLVSSNGGATWTHHDFDSNTVVSDVSMFSDNYGAALTHNVGNIADTLPGKLPDSLFVTTDGWKSWTSHAMPDGVQGCQQVFCFGIDPISVSGWTDSNLMCQFYKTTDGGKSWMILGKFPYVTHIDFINPNLAWGAGTDFSSSPYRGQLIQTTNGGKSWIRRMDTNLSEGFSSVSFADSLHGLLTGQVILRTTDGGASWASEYPPFGVFTPSTFVSQVIEPSPDMAIGVFGTDPVIRFAGKFSLTAPFFHAHDPGPVPITPTTISWTPVIGADKYHLQLGTELLSIWKDTRLFYTPPALDTILSDTELTVSNLALGTLYFGRVAAMNATDTSDWRQSGEWFQPVALFYTVTNAGSPLPPEIISPPSGSHTGTSVAMRVTSVPGATSYSLQFWMEGIVSLIDTTVPDTSFTIQGLLSGYSYSVTVRANVPNDTTDWSNGEYIIVVDASGVSILSNAIAPAVYPNPAQNEVHIQLAESGPIPQFLIYDELGSEIQVPVSEDKNGLTLDVRALPSGIYVIQQLGNQRQTYRFVVAH